MKDLGADRHLEKPLLAAFAGAVFALAVAAVGGDEARREMIIGQVGDIFVGDQDDVAAPATVAAVRAARIFKLFPAK